MRQKPLDIFILIALASGVCSGVSVIVRPLGIVVPGLCFGLALCFALRLSGVPLGLGRAAILIATVTLGYLAAFVTCLLSMRLPGWTNSGFISGCLTGTIAGGTGAAIVALSLAFVVPRLRSTAPFVLTSVTGAVFGAVLDNVGTLISDCKSLGHPIDDLITFPIWQVAVAIAIAWSLEKPGQQDPQETGYHEG